MISLLINDTTCRLVALYAVCSLEEPIYIVEELMDQCLNKYLQEQSTQDKTSLKDLTNMASQVHRNRL